MPASDSVRVKSSWWLESLLWSGAIIVAVAVAAWFDQTVREIVLQGLAYLITFFSTPFVLEASTAFVGLCIVIAINNRRIEREGDGWVEMEIKQPEPKQDSASGEPQSADKSCDI